MAFGIPAALLFGLVLIIASLSLFVTSKLKPNLYEESDNIYVIAGVVCGLLLMVSLDLGAAMAFQQLLLLSATISLMWRLINLRAENKQLKNRQPGTERSKSGYNARLEDDYLDTPRERRQGKRRRDMSYEDEDSRAETLRERRLLGDRQESAVEPMLSRRRTRSFDAEDGGDERYGESREPTVARRRSSWENEETDWSDDRPNPRTAQRALPDADLLRDRSPQRFDRDREDGTARFSQAEDRGWNEAGDTGTTSELDRDNLNESTPRRRRNRSTRPDRDDDDRQDRPTDSRSAKGAMTAYVNYEPVNPEAGLPPSGTEEPIVFPDRY
jgi:Ycf66 protein N-terminus